MMRTVVGMALRAPSVVSSVHERTADSAGSMLRATMSSSPSTMCAPTTSGSITRCGAEA
nr:hypothetical protein [Ornithinicoccus hortensis]